jgi:hypothetical protein
MWQEECANVLFCLKTRVQSNELKVITARPINLTCLKKRVWPLGSKVIQLQPHGLQRIRAAKNENGRLAKEGIDQGEVAYQCPVFADLE